MTLRRPAATNAKNPLAGTKYAESGTSYRIALALAALKAKLAEAKARKAGKRMLISLFCRSAS